MPRLNLLHKEILVIRRVLLRSGARSKRHGRVRRWGGFVFDFWATVGDCDLHAMLSGRRSLLLSIIDAASPIRTVRSLQASFHSVGSFNVIGGAGYRECTLIG